MALELGSRLERTALAALGGSVCSMILEARCALRGLWPRLPVRQAPCLSLRCAMGAEMLRRTSVGLLASVTRGAPRPTSDSDHIHKNVVRRRDPTAPPGHLTLWLAVAEQAASWSLPVLPEWR